VVGNNEGSKSMITSIHTGRVGKMKSSGLLSPKK